MRDFKNLDSFYLEAVIFIKNGKLRSTRNPSKLTNWSY